MYELWTFTHQKKCWRLHLRFHVSVAVPVPVETPGKHRWSAWDVPPCTQHPQRETTLSINSAWIDTLNGKWHVVRQDYKKEDPPSLQSIEESNTISWTTDLNDILPGQLQQVCPWFTHTQKKRYYSQLNNLNMVKSLSCHMWTCSGEVQQFSTCAAKL